MSESVSQLLTKQRLPGGISWLDSILNGGFFKLSDSDRYRASRGLNVALFFSMSGQPIITEG